MRILEIEQQLRKELPLHTNYFSEWFSASSYIVASGIATITTTVSHGLHIGDDVLVDGVEFPNPITSLTSSNGIATAVNQYTSDLTIPFNETVDISDANESNYNGTKYLKTSDRRNKIFTYEVPFDAVSPATGSPILTEKNLARYNGAYEVTSVNSTTEFELAISTFADFTATGTITVLDINNSRIVADITIDHVDNAYTKKSANKYYMFILPDGDGRQISKDRNNSTDFTTTNQYGELYFQKTLEKFSVIVVAPVSNTINGIEAHDICANDIKLAILKTLCNYELTPTFTNCYTAIADDGDQPFGYNGATYMHIYNFSTSVVITHSDVYISRSAAVNKITNIGRSRTDERTIISTDTANLIQP